MDGWMDIQIGWMDRYSVLMIDSCDEWMDGWMDRYDGLTDMMDGWIGRYDDGQIDIENGWIDIQD